MKTCKPFAILLVLIALPLAAQAAEWAPSTFYTVGTLVTYQGPTYRCLQAHTSQVSWEPPYAAALWALQTVGTATPTSSPTSTSTATATPTNTPRVTPTVTSTPTATSTPTNTPRVTPTTPTGCAIG